MQKFEYMIIRCMIADDTLANGLNQAGESGWEAYAANLDRDNYTIVYLKRPLSDTTNRG